MGDTKNQKEKITGHVQIGNLSCHVDNAPEKKADFVEMYKGKLNIDLTTAWNEITKVRAAWKKQNKGKGGSSSKAEETTDSGSAE